MNFYEIVQKLCADKGISMTALALDLGFSKSTPHSWRTDNSKPRAGTIKKVAEYFGVDPQVFSVGMPEKTYTVELPDLSEQENEMIRIFRNLSILNQAKALIYMNDLKSTDRKESGKK